MSGPGLSFQARSWCFGGSRTGISGVTSCGTRLTQVSVLYMCIYLGPDPEILKTIQELFSDAKCWIAQRGQFIHHLLKTLKHCSIQLNVS